MYLYKIVLTTNDYNFKDSKVIQDTIFDYLGALYKNGQILYITMNLLKKMENSVYIVSS